MSNAPNKSRGKDKERALDHRALGTSLQKQKNLLSISPRDVQKGSNPFWIAKDGEFESGGSGKSIIALMNKIERESTHRVEAYMAQFYLSVDDIGTATYTEIRNVLLDYSNNTTTKFTDQDFDNVAFTIPQHSPSQYQEPTQEDSSSNSKSASKRRELQRAINAEGILSLLNVDRLRELQFINEDVVREWWAENRLEWVENKVQFDRCQVALESLALQPKRLRKISIKDLETTENLDRLAYQRQTLLFEMNSRLQILAAYKMCMKEAIYRLEVLQGDPTRPNTPKLMSNIDRSWHNPSKEEAEPIFNYGLSKASWYNACDFPVWLTGAVTFIDRYSKRVPTKIRRLQVELSMMIKTYKLEEAKMVSLRGEQKRKDALFDKDIDFMERYQDFAFPIDGRPDSQSSSSVEGIMWKDKIKMEKHRKDIQHNKISEGLREMKQRLRRISLLRELTGKQIDDYENYVRLASSLSGLIYRILELKDIHVAHPTYKSHYHAVYQIFIQLGGNKANLKLLEQHVTLHHINQLSDVSINQLNDFLKEYRDNRAYFPGNTDEFAKKLNEVIPAKNIWSPLYDVSRGTLAEKNAVRHTVMDIFTVGNKPQEIGEETEVEIPLPERLQDTPRNEKNGNWDTVPEANSASQILARLEQDMDGKWFELHDLLSHFFVSPDVAHIFITMIDLGEMSSGDFLDLTNSLIAKKLQWDEVEAFLIWCHESDFLFKYSPEKEMVYLCPKLRGWEFVHEMLVAGPAREGLYIAPLKTRAIEERLISRQKVCKFDTYGFDDRTIQESGLIAVIDSVWQGKSLEQGEVHSVLQYWHSTGRMFTMLEERTTTGERLYKRLDNGWPPLDHGLYARINRSGKHYQYIKYLMKTDAKYITRSAFIKQDGKLLTESDLYSMLKHLLVYKIGTFGSVKEKQVTRHDFHKFLRWCNDQCCLFRLWRDGTIELVNRGWGKRMYVEDNKNLYDA